MSKQEIKKKKTVTKHIYLCFFFKKQLSNTFLFLDLEKAETWNKKQETRNRKQETETLPSGPLISEVKKGKNEINDIRKITNSVINESMFVHKSPLKSFSKRKEIKIERKHDDEEKHCPTLKER